MQAFLKNFGKRIRAMRHAEGHKQETIAKLLKMSSSGYAKIERGESDIRISRIEKIANIYGMKTSQLIHLIESPFVLEPTSRDSSPNFPDDNEQQLANLLKKTIESLTQLMGTVMKKRMDKGNDDAKVYNSRPHAQRSKNISSGSRNPE
jgi:transcriptional regulator with XRE-family HTH domain